MNMYKVRIDNFDLEQVAKSGQCFRWIKNGENTYNIAAFGREVDITQNGNEFTLSCDEDEWNKINSQMVLFGRYICTSKNPKCDKCHLKNICKYK